MTILFLCLIDAEFIEISSVIEMPELICPGYIEYKRRVEIKAKGL